MAVFVFRKFDRKQLGRGAHEGKPSVALHERNSIAISFGGETGIRTLETVASLIVFKTIAFDHSAISPQLRSPVEKG